MKFAPSYVKTTALAALAAATMSACVIAPPRHVVVQSAPQPQPQVVYNTYPVYEQQPAAPVVYGNAPPPPVQVEVVPVQPFPGAVFINGYWGWNGGRRQWVPGHYTRPQAGYRFAPHRWEPAGGRWVLRGGFWVR